MIADGSQASVGRRDSAPDLVARIHAAAAEAGLGAHQARYWWTTPLNTPRKLALLLLVGIPVTPLVQSPPHPRDALISGVVALILGVPVVGGLLYGANQRSRRLDLFEHGLTMAQRGGVRVVRYADTMVLLRIREYGGGPHGGPIHTTHRYTLADVSGAKFTITNRIERHDEWALTVQQAIADAQFPAAVAALAAGTRLDFGAFWITERQFGRGKHVWSWTDIIDLGVTKMTLHLVLRNRFRPMAVQVHRIPNFRLFVALAEHYAPGARMD